MKSDKVKYRRIIEKNTFYFNNPDFERMVHAFDDVFTFRDC